MAKVIKGGGALGVGEELGTISPDTGFADMPRKKPAIVSKEEYAAGNDARKIVGDAETRAQSIVAEAEAKAQEIVAAAQQQAEQLREQAKQQGHAEGSNEASAKLMEVVATSSRRLEQREAEAAGQIRQLSIAIAKKIIGKELEFHPDAVVEMAKKHLGTIRQRREVYMRVSPHDLDALREHKRDLIDQLGRAKEIEIRADEGLSPGSMIIETEAGTVDARVETQMAVIERVLMGKPPV
jgi:flagellar biosynthesis/type III secretory pathway protein FliH